MSFPKKVLSILAIIFVMRVLSGCFCHCPDDNTFYDLEKMDIFSINYPYDYQSTSEIDTMSSSYVGFRIVMSPQNMRIYESPINTFAFSKANACDCSERVFPNQFVEKIEIISLYDFNEKYPKNSDVTELFVARTSYSTGLYEPINEISKSLGKKNNGVYRKQEFYIYLKEKVVNTEARFKINVKISDNTIFSDTTNYIKII